VAVQPAHAVRDQQWAIGAAAERRIDCADGLRSQRHQRALAALASHREDPMGALDTKGVVASRSGLGRGQEPDCLLAVKPKRPGSRATEGRRTWAAGEWGSAPSWTA
jgi:hypothetical protein